MKTLVRTAMAAATFAASAVLVSVPSASAAPATAAPAGAVSHGKTSESVRALLASRPAGTRGTNDVFGPFFIVSANSGRCVNVKGAATGNSVPLIQFDCVNAANNHWFLIDSGDGVDLFIQSASSSRCMNVKGAATGNSVPLIQFDCVAALNNLWFLST